MEHKNDQALVMLIWGGEHPHGYVLASRGPYQCRRDTNPTNAFAFERDEIGSHIDDIGIGYQFKNNKPGLWLWDGDVWYCPGNCNYEYPGCDCAPKFNGKARPATVDDLHIFNVLIES